MLPGYLLALQRTMKTIGMFGTEEITYSNSVYTGSMGLLSALFIYYCRFFKLFEPSPKYSLQFLFETADTLIGLIIFAVIIGDIGNMVANINATKAGLENVLDGCKQYMINRRVPLQLQKKVINWLSYTRDTGQLRIHEQDCELSLLSELILMMKLQAFSSGDYVFKKGEIGKKMYIVRRGQLEVINDDDATVLAILKEGSVFGELSILNIPGNKDMNKRTATVRSIGFSDLHVLEKESLQNVLDEYPDVKQSFIEKGKKLLQKDGLLNMKQWEEEVMDLEEHKNMKQSFLRMQNIADQLNDNIEKLFGDLAESSNEMKRRLFELENGIPWSIQRDCDCMPNK
uniref:Cyclic nucleotide-binding domain-containing protein n=1 Tax=Setaria digitata TaxID=48799 RepID=A0A915PDQ1_9BILA